MSVDLHINPNDILRQAQSRTSADQLERLRNAGLSSGSEERDRALLGLSYEFEKILLEQMMASMRKTVKSDGIFGQSLGGSMYMEMFDTEIINQSVGSYSMGLAETIYRQLIDKGGEAVKSVDIKG